MGKRIFDLAVLIIAAPLLVPVMLIVAMLVRWQIGRPVFFVQERPGMHGCPFSMVKFRSMTNEVDAVGNLLPDSNRLNWFGRFLRSTSLDELPELWNVLRGEMSLVGPRPLLMEYLPLYSADQARRHEVRPGITGWAQVNGRNALSWSKKFQLDVWYVDNQSVWLDVKILAMTVLRVLRRDGIAADGQATMPRFRGADEPGS